MLCLCDVMKLILNFLNFPLTYNWSRDDMVYDELKKPDEARKPMPLDEDLPGMGQYYCVHCEYVSLFF